MGQENDWEIGKIGNLTVHISPDRELQSLRATVAWRNEVFAYLFPVDGHHFAIGTSDKWNEASTIYMRAWDMETAQWDAVKSKIIELLRAHIERQKKHSEERISSLTKAVCMLNKLAPAKAA